MQILVELQSFDVATVTRTVCSTRGLESQDTLRPKISEHSHGQWSNYKERIGISGRVLYIIWWAFR